MKLKLYIVWKYNFNIEVYFYVTYKCSILHGCEENKLVNMWPIFVNFYFKIHNIM